EHIAGFTTNSAYLHLSDQTERVRIAEVSTDFFPIFKTNAISGRTVQADDTKDDADGVVISHALWQRRFGGTSDVVGRKIKINGWWGTIIGIMPPGFTYPSDREIWWGRQFNPAKEARENRYISAVARLKPGVSLAQAQTELDTISQRLAQTYVDTNAYWGVQLTELRERLVKKLKTSLLVLLGAVTFVLLIACANVANLLLARAASRQKEIALRTALGASRWRVVRQLLTESVMLSVVSGVAGLGLSIWLIKLLVAITPPNTPRLDEIRIDLRVFGF